MCHLRHEFLFHEFLLMCMNSSILKAGSLVSLTQAMRYHRIRMCVCVVYMRCWCVRETPCYRLPPLGKRGG